MDFTSKFTVYDILSILTAGYLLIGATSESLEIPAFFVLIFSYAFGLAFHHLINQIRCLHNPYCIIRKTAIDFFKNKKPIGAPYDDKTALKEDYFHAYYRLVKQQRITGSSIPVLEAQSAFCRNLAVISWIHLVVFILRPGWITIWGKHICCCESFFYCYCISLIILCFVLPFIWYKIEIKIHSLIWEMDYYLNLVNSSTDGRITVQENNAGDKDES